jgi:hypothetical protein
MSNQKDSELLRLLAVWVTEKWQVIAASFCRMIKSTAATVRQS